MKAIRTAAAAAALVLAAGVAHAEDKAPCGAAMICASDPSSVMAALKEAGYDPKLTKDNSGDPYIEVDADYHFDVFFYGCSDNERCDSLRFEVAFQKEPGIDNALANRWNDNKRFLQMAVKKDGSLLAAYDVATIGGINKNNFADILDWWQTMMGELDQFFEDTLRKKEGAK